MGLREGAVAVLEVDRWDSVDGRVSRDCTAPRLHGQGVHSGPQGTEAKRNTVVKRKAALARWDAE